MAIVDLPAEIQGIINDPKNPEHDAYQRGDPAVTEKVSQAYKARYGVDEPLDPELAEFKKDFEGKFRDSAEPPLDPELQRMKDEYEAKPVIPDDLGESAQVAVDLLKQQWGENFDSNYKSTMEVVSTLPREQMEALHNSYEGIGNDPDVLTVLSEIGRGKGADLSPVLLEKIEKRYPAIGTDARVKSLLEELRKRF